jgi:hypothetical protein
MCCISESHTLGSVAVWYAPLSPLQCRPKDLMKPTTCNDPYWLDCMVFRTGFGGSTPLKMSLCLITFSYKRDRFICWRCCSSGLWCRIDSYVDTYPEHHHPHRRENLKFHRPVCWLAMGQAHIKHFSLLSLYSQDLMELFRFWRLQGSYSVSKWACITSNRRFWG